MKIAGALFVCLGILYAVWVAISARRLSSPPRHPDNQNAPTLEPRRQGLGFLGVARNWPALALIAIGVLMLIYPM
ncbi:hypothetical protein GF108_17925 [Phyllobacterium sp. SYP-B3895]|uniref:hypothetical protein n=1 Tax=Phyllobacterium sp. SYP-B3895 TaxID=2663240 RepID=UPI00129989D6|nr:hypothetical protein [Phyllobacterium sp. SYP-B3895]MRG57449.1 hypothetical protein [Phyllobacterium sp. SYP-B3895]